MSILVVLIPLGLVLVAIALWAFIWAVNHDQFEDLDRAAHSILFDDDLPPESEPRRDEAHAAELPDASAVPGRRPDDRRA